MKQSFVFSKLVTVTAALVFSSCVMAAVAAKKPAPAAKLKKAAQVTAPLKVSEPIHLEDAEDVRPQSLSLEEALQKNQAQGAPAVSIEATEVPAPAEEGVNEAGVATMSFEEISKKTEDQIPIKTAKVNKSAESDPIFLKLLMSFGVVGILFIGGFFFMKKYSVKANKKGSEKRIKIITQHYLGPKKSLAIVRVAGETILIGVTDHNISMLKSLSLVGEDESELIESNEQASTGFAKIFSRSFHKTKTVAAVPEDSEEFMMGQIKDTVKSKLKNLRSYE